MTWTDNDLQNLKSKGLKIDDFRREATVLNPVPDVPKSQKVKIQKISVEKNAIQLVLEILKHEKKIDDFVKELKFDPNRKFRFDWAIPNLMIAIEYEGIYSKKSRHTTVSGYSKDIEKYNLAITKGWRVLRYTADNYKNLETDLLKML